MCMTFEQAAKRLSSILEEQRAKIDGLPPLMKGRTALNSVVEALEMAITALREKAERENPQPLTLEELRGMIGKPVYVVGCGGGGWEIFEGCDDCGFWCADESFYSAGGYDKSWTAYRHKPKEAQK